MFLISLGSTRGREKREAGEVVGINQIVWDTFTNTLHVESDELLAQHTRYALIVTNGVRDVGGRPVKATTAFARFRQTVRGKYKQALLEAIHAAWHLGVRERDIVTASVYTTQSITSVMERIRDQNHNETPPPAIFSLGPNGERASSSGERDKHPVEPALGVSPHWVQPPHPLTWESCATSPMRWEQSHTAPTYLPNTGFQASNTTGWDVGGDPACAGYTNSTSPCSCRLARGPAGWACRDRRHSPATSTSPLASVAAMLASQGMRRSASTSWAGDSGRWPLAITLTDAAARHPRRGAWIDQNGDN